MADIRLLARSLLRPHDGLLAALIVRFVCVLFDVFMYARFAWAPAPPRPVLSVDDEARAETKATAYGEGKAEAEVERLRALVADLRRENATLKKARA